MGASLCVALASTVAHARPTPTPIPSKACVETSHVVGYSSCRRYGRGWTLESAVPFTFELTLGASFMDTSTRTMRGSFGKKSKDAFAYPGSVIGHSLGVATLGTRFLFPFVSWFYAGFALELGAGGNTLPRTNAGPYWISSTAGWVNSFGFAGGAFAGVRVPLGYVAFRLETTIGGRAIWVSQRAAPLPKTPEPATVSIETGAIEPRAFVDLWAAPWLTTSGFVGFDALHPRDFLVGMSLGFHARSYDGGFSF